MSKMEVGDSNRTSSASPEITIRAPGWFKTLYVGSFIAWVVLASVLLLVGHSRFTTAISLMFWVLAAVTLPVAVASVLRRLEYRKDKLVLIRLTGRVECPVQEVASIRLSPAGNGTSFCVIFKKDGTLIDARGGWRTAELIDLGRRIRVGTQGPGTQDTPAKRFDPTLVSHSDQVAFIGGMRASGFNVSWPFAGLTFTDQGFTLRFVGLVHLRGDWAQVESAQRVIGGLLRSAGVRLVLVDGRRIVFWSFQPDAVLNALRARGVHITDPGGPPPKVWLGS